MFKNKNKKIRLDCTYTVRDMRQIQEHRETLGIGENIILIIKYIT